MEFNKIIQGDSLEVLKTLPEEIVDCCITSPPYYGLRDYGIEGQIGLEESPEDYVQKLVDVFHEVKRVLKPDGTLWVNIGDSYVAKPKSNYDGKGKSLNDVSYGTGDTTLGYKQSSEKYKNLLSLYKNKDLIGIPWLLAFALRNDGWYLRQDIIWNKPNPMPESVKDRCTKSHEYIFLLSKNPRYYFDYKAIQENANPKYKSRYNSVFNAGKAQENFRPNHATNTMGMKNYTGKKNKRDVWSVNVKPIHEAHFATFPEDLIKPCILAGCKVGGVVLDPFFGSGTTGIVAQKYNRNYLGIELNSDYIEIAKKRNSSVQLSIESLM